MAAKVAELGDERVVWNGPGRSWSAITALPAGSRYSGGRNDAGMQSGGRLSS